MHVRLHLEYRVHAMNWSLMERSRLRYYIRTSCIQKISSFNAVHWLTLSFNFVRQSNCLCERLTSGKTTDAEVPQRRVFGSIILVNRKVVKVGRWMIRSVSAWSSVAYTAQRITVSLSTRSYRRQFILITVDLIMFAHFRVHVCSFCSSSMHSEACLLVSRPIRLEWLPFCAMLTP